MNGAEAHTINPESVSDERTSAVFTGGALFEGIGAIASIALAIVGLAGVLSNTIAAIAMIVLGVAILLEGGALEWSNGRFIRATGSESIVSATAATADLQAGIAAIVLGILALIGIDSMVLLSVSLMAVGAAFLFTGRFLSGIAGIVLGILAVVGNAPLNLVLVGTLVLGAGLLFAGFEMAMGALAERT